MRTHRNTAYIAFGITVISLILALLFNYLGKSIFWANIFIGVFGSGFLTTFASLVGYSVERRKTFEGFRSSTYSILNQLNRYRYDANLDEKISLILFYYDIPKHFWDQLYGNFAFLYKGNALSYIYQNIYKPILELDKKISENEHILRFHQDGTAKNEKASKDAIESIERLFIEKYEEKKDGLNVTIYQNGLVKKVRRELNGKYYDMMYPCTNKKRNQQVDND